MPSSSSRAVNPFYIEPGDVESAAYNDYGYDDWQNDTDDLDELLEHESPLGGYQRGNARMSPHRHRHRHDLPVANLAYDYDPALRRRLRLSLLLLLAVVLIATMLSTSSSSSGGENSNQVMKNGRYHHDDDTDNATTTSALQIAVLGERHSGLSWFTKRLQECYPYLSVSSSLQRPGTWFQYAPPTTPLPPTLVLVATRNPYDWVEQMRLHPEDAPSHSGRLSWEAFVTKPWTLDGYNASTTSQTGTTTTVCQLGFAPSQVVPCEAPSDLLSPAVYELQPSSSKSNTQAGQHFDSIVDLRAAKIRNFVDQVAQWDGVLQVLPVQYEQLVGDALDAQGKHSALPGILTTLNVIKERLGLEYQCDVTFDKSLFAPAMGNHKSMTQSFVDWMNAHVDWDAEALVGYEPWDTIPPSQVNWDESNPEGVSHDDDEESYEDSVPDESHKDGDDGGAESESQVVNDDNESENAREGDGLNEDSNEEGGTNKSESDITAETPSDNVEGGATDDNDEPDRAKDDAGSDGDDNKHHADATDASENDNPGTGDDESDGDSSAADDGNPKHDEPDAESNEEDSTTNDETKNEGVSSAKTDTETDESTKADTEKDDDNHDTSEADDDESVEKEESIASPSKAEVKDQEKEAPTEGDDNDALETGEDEPVEKEKDSIPSSTEATDEDEEEDTTPIDDDNDVSETGEDETAEATTGNHVTKSGHAVNDPSRGKSDLSAETGGEDTEDNSPDAPQSEVSEAKQHEDR